MLIGPDLGHRMLGGTAHLRHSLMPPERDRSVHPTKAGGRGDEQLCVLRAEEPVSVVDGLKNLERALGVGGWVAKLFELVMRPIHQANLPIELVLPRHYDLVEVVSH